jgi:hypothetical protein
MYQPTTSDAATPYPANLSQHLDYAPKHKLTESEVLAAARSIRELQSLRVAAKGAAPAKIEMDGRSTHWSIPLEPDEFQAVLALLIERHTIVLASLGITPDVPAA